MQWKIYHSKSQWNRGKLWPIKIFIIKFCVGSLVKVWIDGELFANVKSFEAKISLKYEAVDINGEMGVHQRLVGFEGAGTLVLHKIDSRVAQKLQVKLKMVAFQTLRLCLK